jgi:hypothetical protein
MQRVRGLAARGRAVVALALVGGLLLTGCQDSPTVAAYVGSEQITEARIDQLVDEVEAKTAGQENVGAPTRAAVVMTVVLDKVCENKQAQEKFPDRAMTDQERQQIAPVAGVEYFTIRLNAFSCLYGIPNPAGIAPTDEELRDIYDRAAVKGLINLPYAEVKDRIAALQEVPPAIGTKRMITEMMAGADIRVNPRYRPLEFIVSDLGSGQPLVVALVGDAGSDAVRDVS